jgi:hypothetical protein
MRAERLAERTEANVATARTSVPAPVANDEIVAQSIVLTVLPGALAAPFLDVTSILHRTRGAMSVGIPAAADRLRISMLGD